MYTDLLLCVASLPSLVVLLASDQTHTPPTPTGAIGLIIWLICAARRKREIGGWLLYYYIQLYMGLLVTLLVAAFSFHNYLPSTWATHISLYPLFLLSTLPALVILPLQLVFAERLRLSRDYRHVYSLRIVLWVDLAAAIIASIIDASFFKANLVFDVLALIWPLIWLPYFYKSKRVVRVFQTKDWLPTPPPVSA